MPPVELNVLLNWFIHLAKSFQRQRAECVESRQRARKSALRRKQDYLISALVKAAKY